MLMHDAFFYSQKEIYRSGKITGAMRILKGQEMLPDDSTLVQHNILDGDTINVIIEPDKQITVEVLCYLGTFQHEISSSMLVRDLKQKLSDSEQVTFLLDQFCLEAKLSDTCVKSLKDDSLPLHEYGIRDDCKLFVVRPYMFVTLVSPHGKKRFTKVLKVTNVRKLKNMIKQLYCGNNVTDICCLSHMMNENIQALISTVIYQ